LYDLEADPGEVNNVIQNPSYRKECNALRSEVRAYFREHGAPPIDEWRATTKQHLPPDSQNMKPTQSRE